MAVGYGMNCAWLGQMDAVQPGVAVLSVLGIMLYYAFQVGAFIFGFRWAHAKGWPFALSLPLTWVVAEYAASPRVFSGNAFANLAFCDAQATWMLAAVPAAGIWGQKWVLLSISGLIADFVYAWHSKDELRQGLSQSGKRSWIWAGCSLTVSFFVLLLGAASQAKWREINQQPFYTVGMVQSQDHYQGAWTSEQRAKFVSTMRALPEGMMGQPADMIVWPEGQLPWIFGSEPGWDQSLHDALRAVGVWQIVGGNYYPQNISKPGYVQNAALLFNPQGSLSGISAKEVLLPFAEFPPWNEKAWYLLAEAFHARGLKGSLVGRHCLLAWNPRGGVIPIGALICFESAIPGLARRLTNDGAEVLLVLSNDRWFDRTVGQTQNAWHAVFRAAENGRYLIRAAPSGVSGIINPLGRWQELMPMNKLGLGLGKIQPRSEPTPYTRWGDWLPRAGILFLALVLFATWVRPAFKGLSPTEKI
jgi:apolipoprotein N-acyltransferase